jgi:hypothetical protein
MIVADQIAGRKMKYGNWGRGQVWKTKGAAAALYKKTYPQ